MQIIEKESNQNINPETAYWKLDILRKDIESIFFEYEKLNPPFNCDSLHRRIMNLMVKFQEVIVYNQEYLRLVEKYKPESRETFRESLTKLEEFRAEFRILNEIVKTNLIKK